MPRLRTSAPYLKRWKEKGDWDALRKAQALQNKPKAYREHPVKPAKLYHGSPYKLKKGQKLKPGGPIFYGEHRSAVHGTTSLNEARRYARESDQGGINKRRYGKRLEPGVFAKKGYVYHTNAQKHPGWFKQYHEGADKTHWGSYHSQSWDKRTSVRFRGKLPITKHEGAAIVGVAAVGGAGYYGYKHRKQIKARAQHLNDHFHGSRERHTS